MPATRTAFRFDPEWRITLFALVMIPVMVGLGCWQLQRAAEKAAIGASWEQRQQQPPAPLDELWDRPGGTLPYERVKLSGSFLADKYFLLDNRIHGGRFGYEVLGIVQLTGSGRLVLVNRGWIAGDPARRDYPVVPQVPGPVDLSGHVYLVPGAPYLLAEQALSDGWPKLLQAVEMDKLAPAVSEISATSLFPNLVRIDEGVPGALTVDWQIVNVSPQKHQAYAVQWFTMALVLIIFYLLRCSNVWQWLRESRRVLK